MLRLSAKLRAAAALLAAALVVLAQGCGGDDDPSPTPPATEEATPPTESQGPITGDVVDLGEHTPLFSVMGEDDEDLATGSHSLSLGDFNGDDVPDVLIGAPQADGPDNERAEAGEAYVMFGPLEGELDLAGEQADMTVYGALPGDSLGYSTAAGDLNGDGTDDVLVAAPGVTAGFDPRTDQGRIYVFYGGSELQDVYDLSEDVYDFTVTGAEGFSRLGHSMDVGDVDGDGAIDLVGGAPFAGRAPGSPPGSERTGLGEVYVIFGSGDLSGEKNVASLHQDVLLSGRQGPPNFGEFGAALTVGDMDGDGTDDIAVGAHRTDGAADRSASGVVFVFKGRDDWPERLTTQDDEQDAVIIGPSAGAGFGFPLSSSDFDGDGTDDIAVGAQTEASDGGPSAGSVRVILGGSSLEGTIDLTNDEADVVLPGTHPGSLLPGSLSAADIDEDGSAELMVGAPFSGQGEGRRSGGLVYIVKGGAGFTQATLGGTGPGKPLLGAEIDDKLGTAIAGGLMAEGQGGVAALAPGAGAGEGRENAGAVYLVPVPLE
jgi:hypothetical protein